MRGRPRPSGRGGIARRRKPPCSRISFLRDGYPCPRISIPVCTLEQCAKSVMDALYQPGCGLDVETAAGANGHPTNIRAQLPASRHDRTHQVPGLKPECTLAAGQGSAWEAMPVEPCALIAPASCALDVQRRNPPVGNSVDFAHTGCIQRMRLWKVEPMSVPLRPPARSSLDRQGCGRQAAPPSSSRT